MMGPVGLINWEDLFESFPAFLTITVMPFTYSIANGVLAGVVSYAILFGVTRSVAYVSKFFAKEEINLHERPLLPSPHVTATPWEETERAEGMRRVVSGNGLLRNASFGDLDGTRIRRETSFTDFTRPDRSSPSMPPFGTPQTQPPDMILTGAAALTKADFILCEGASDSGFSGATPDP
jgi:hypothetical protein